MRWHVRAAFRTRTLTTLTVVAFNGSHSWLQPASVHNRTKCQHLYRFEVHSFGHCTSLVRPIGIESNGKWLLHSGRQVLTWNHILAISSLSFRFFFVLQQCFVSFNKTSQIGQYIRIVRGGGSRIAPSTIKECNKIAAQSSSSLIAIIDATNASTIWIISSINWLQCAFKLRHTHMIPVENRGNCMASGKRENSKHINLLCFTMLSPTFPD